MNPILARTLGLCALLVLLGIPSVASAQNPVQRYSIVAGSNNGGVERVKLAYAESDAQKFADVLQTLGGVEPQNTLMLFDPSLEELEQSFVALEGLLEKAPPGRVEVIFYYSGHSDEQGLLPNGELLGYKDLRNRFDALSADVRVIVLDSCSAGAVTRAKGGVQRAAFLIDESTEVSGHAFLTPSSADEVAQESDRIEGSFFTHYLVSGLRGAADVSGDERVTLNEAYQFAFQETLNRTESTRGGAQHPAYEIQLSGTGDLVLTDLRTASATLVLGKELDGRFFIHDGVGKLVVELAKSDERAIPISLVPGAYLVRADRDGELFEAKVLVRDDAPVTLSADLLVSKEIELATARGGVRFVDRPPAEPDYTYVPYEFGIIPSLSVSNIVTDGPVRSKIAGYMLVGGVDRSDMLMAAMLIGWADDRFTGLVFGGIGSQTGGVGEGLTFGGVYARHEGSLEGVQFGGVAALLDGRVTGVQFGGVYSGADDVLGLQLGGVAAWSQRLQGAQVSVVNIGGHVLGAQVGVVNIADEVDGVQVGVVNIARESKVPVGLLNFIENGVLRFDLWASELSPVNVGLKWGGEYVYTLLGAGVQVEGTGADQQLMELQFGLGGHIPIDPIFIDVDLSAASFVDDLGSLDSWLGRLRIAAGYRIFAHLAVFAGASVNLMVVTPGSRLGFPTGGPFEPKVVSTPDMGMEAVSEQVAIFPGFFAGLEF